MSASLDTLQDDDIRPGRFRQQRIFERTDLVQDKATGLLGLCDDLGEDGPEEAQRRNLRRGRPPSPRATAWDRWRRE
jgi:hypothetical protein